MDNPHRQRAQYCELLLSDFLMRVPCGRFPPIEEELALLRAQCGALELHPRAVLEAGLKLNVLEALQRRPGAAPGVLPDSLATYPAVCSG